MNKSLFKDAYSKSQKSDELTSGPFGLIKIARLIGKNVVEIKLPDHLKIHNVINVIHTAPYNGQPSDIAAQPLKYLIRYQTLREMSLL